MVGPKSVTLAIKTSPAMAAEFEQARKAAGFQSRAQYFWFLHMARKGAEMISESEKRLLLELGHYGNVRFHEPTPSLDDPRLIHQFSGGSDGLSAAAKALESLIMKGLMREMPGNLVGLFANDLVYNGRRYRLTPEGSESLRALGYRPLLAP